MAYHIFMGVGSPGNEADFNIYLGSAITLHEYWESVGYKLGLPIISEITENADSEDGLVLSGVDLESFRNEMVIFEKYWIDKSSTESLPDRLLLNIKKIIQQSDYAYSLGLDLMIA